MESSSSNTNLCQRCNLCWGAANGQCYRTTCKHLFCESCAYRQFGESQICPICGKELLEQDVWEMIVGVEPSQISTQIYQEIYRDPDWSAIINSTMKNSSVIQGATGFVLEQLSLDLQRMIALNGDLKNELAKHKQESGKIALQWKNQASVLEQRLKETEHRMKVKEKEFDELQEAYKEKMRKCQAWEKAYNSLRSQLETGGNGIKRQMPNGPLGFSGNNSDSGSSVNPASPEQRSSNGSNLFNRGGREMGPPPMTTQNQHPVLLRNSSFSQERGPLSNQQNKGFFKRQGNSPIVMQGGSFKPGLRPPTPMMFGNQVSSTPDRFRFNPDRGNIFQNIEG